MRAFCISLLVPATLVVAAAGGQDGRGDGTVNDPVLIEAQKLTEAGRLADARKLLSDRRDNPSADIARRRDEQIEVIRRIRLEYSVTEAQMLEKLRKSIPDATLADIRRWRDAGELQHRVLDGVVLYWEREPSNLFKFCKEARERRDRTPEGASKTASEKNAAQALARRVAEIVAEADKTGKAEVLPVRHRVHYSLTLKPRPGRLKKGSLVRIWMVYPQEYRQQGGVRLIESTPEVTTISPNWDQARHGEFQRTLYFEQRVEDPGKPVGAKVVYEWTCAAYCPRLDAAGAKPCDTGSELYRTYTSERPPHILFSPEIRAVVAKETAGVDNPLEKARRLWLYVAKNMRYRYEVEYSTIPSISQMAVKELRGDCGVHAMLFITLCRAAGIPARWQSGWETKPEGYTMHDWAEFYIEPWGWLPADPTYGLQDSGDPRVREFFFGRMDAHRCIVNLDYGCPFVPAKESFRSEPVDSQRGEVEVDGENLYFDEWDSSFRVQWLQ